MSKDWTGGTTGVFTAIGASNHSEAEREINDFYATDPAAIDALLGAYGLPRKVWEPACGAGHLAARLSERGYDVEATDLIYRGYGRGGVDFLGETDAHGCACILTNPPYKYAAEFVVKALELLPPGGICAMFVKTTFLEGARRREMIFDKTPPCLMLQFTKRILCARNGDFSSAGASAVAYCWMIWKKGWRGDTVIKWI